MNFNQIVKKYTELTNFKANSVGAESYCESAEQAFRNIGNNDANEKDNSIEPVVAKPHCNEKE